MVFQYLTEENLGSEYEDAKEYTELLTKPFPEFDRIANNMPSDQRDERYSDVTDGTTAALIRKIGKRVVQQIPTGRITSDNDDDWLPIVAEFVFLHKILPYANMDYDFIQKCWQIIENGAKYGGAPTYVPFINHDGYFCTDLSLPFWGDVFHPRGYRSAYSAPFLFIRDWWQERDFDDQIAQEKRAKRNAKRRGEEYESTWDIEGLKMAKKAMTKKEEHEQSVSERERNTNPEGVEVVTAFQVGVKSTFYTFCPSTDASDEHDPDDVTILRRKINKDPRGKMPLPWFYFDTDGSNPLGRSLIDLIGPLQNLIDDDMAMYQWNRALSLAPPVVSYGISNKKVVYAPNAVITANKPDAKLDPLNIDTSAITNYPSLYGLQKSQLLNLAASPDGSISSEVGNPGFSKTHAGVEQIQQNISIDDNYVRKNFEAWFENWAETAINVFFAERTGKDVLQLDKKTVGELQKLADKGKFDMRKINDRNEILIDYDTETPALKFRVDASTSKMKDDVTQSEVLSGLIDRVDKSQILSKVIPEENIIATWNSIVSNSGAEDPEDLKVDMDQWREMKAKEEAALNAAGAAGDMAGGATMPELSPEDEQIITLFKQQGVPDEIINQALQMLDNGHPADAVLSAVAGVMANA